MPRRPENRWAVDDAILKAHCLAYNTLGRPVEAGEWEHLLPEWVQQELDMEPSPEAKPTLEEVEAALVPCGC